FEFIEGTNLRDVVKAEGPFELARAIDLTIQIADALEHASEREVVHRDIKPSNIIITPAGRARLVDMGLARLHHVASDQDLTVSGMTLGTFDYISPEQARDPRSADVRSDLYSLGCTLFFMLVGRPPFADGTMVQKLLQHQQDEPPAIETLRPDLPKRFATILSRLMAKQPEDRYQRPASLIGDLISFADDNGIELAAPRPAVVVPFEPSVRRPKTSVLPWLVPLLGLLGVVAALGLRSLGRVPVAPETGDSSPGGVAAVDGDQERAVDGASGPLRVVDAPAAPREHASLAEAIGQAADGDVIELACSAVRDEPPLVVSGRRLSLRAAAGCRPVVRFVDSGGDPPGGDGVARAACTILEGGLDIRGVALELAASATATPGNALRRTALFALRGSATLACEDVELRMPGEADRGRSGGIDRAPHDGNAFVRIVDSGAGQEVRRDVRMIRSTASGDAVLLEAAGGGRVDLVWSGGTCATATRFLFAEGSAAGDGPGIALALSLDGGTFACGEGFACLLDSSSRPVFPRLRAFADGCRFLVPQGKSLLEQSGVADPDLYRPAVEWIDGGSRYEGSDVFRRIDGSAERVEMDYAASPQPLIHSHRLDDWPVLPAGGRRPAPRGRDDERQGPQELDPTPSEAIEGRGDRRAGAAGWTPPIS
ncbi:MAG: serine/threonine protein kinase, partial [Planctomycetia bacterium]|nr:serine/threonine protein kinase [Planctomycetia bacterium]